jgi:hypothetical protein
MTLRFGIRFPAVLLLLAFAAPARPDDPASAQGPGQAPATQDEVKALAEEVRRLKLELGLRDVEYASYAGMGPAASKVYFAPKGLSLGGYGEINYQNSLDDRIDQSDLLRVVLYTGYRFTDRIVFNAEVEYEHHSELSVEFAYLDFAFREEVGLRAGNVLLPVGFANLVHEPPFFNGVFRPEVERKVIPSTWNENGLGLYGRWSGFRYQAYLVVGLDATGGGLEPGSWLREARTGGGEAPAEDLAGVVSLGWERGPVSLGASLYRGNAGQGARDASGVIDAPVTLFEAHGQLAWRGLTVRGLWAAGRLGDAARISALQGGEVIGSEVSGFYLDASYDVLASALPDAGQSLSPFVRYERLDLHAAVPAGLVRDPALAYGFLTAGLVYRPIPTVAVKADYQRKDGDDDSTEDQLNLGIGFAF